MNQTRPEDEDPLSPTAVDAVEENTVDDEATRVAAVIEALQAEVAAAKDQTLRALADAENTRKRALKEREDAGKYAISAFARDLLEFSDNFHRAMTAIPDEVKTDERIVAVMTGIEAMEKDLFSTFEKHGIQKITPLGEMFNPNFHEALFEAPGTGKPGGMIIQVVEPGYIIKDRLLRPARVGVAKADDGAPAGGHVDTQA
ncbi:MAG: nucleotide exchange factor GrpE [Alphaproteobacteria bacterium]|nr:nucleotide exchange factor GrpE [Alphaproteobacteria bacterium]